FRAQCRFSNSQASFQIPAQCATCAVGEFPGLSFQHSILPMLTGHEIEIRVRYQETDGQGRVHHANYLTWFELGRVELLRAGGHSYRELEEAGIFLVVAEVIVQYYLPAFFDDRLRLRTTTIGAKGARIVHEYEVLRGDQILA